MGCLPISGVVKSERKGEGVDYLWVLMHKISNLAYSITPTMSSK